MKLVRMPAVMVIISLTTMMSLTRVILSLVLQSGGSPGAEVHCVQSSAGECQAYEPRHGLHLA